MEEHLRFNHMWTDPFTKSSGKSHAPLFQTPENSADYFAWLYTSIAFTHFIHILHILWGLRVVVSLKPSRDSGAQVGSPLCPKRVGCFGSSTRFQMRKVVGKWYRFCKKIMSLVYAKKSDDIGMCFMCASRVSTCECSVCSVWYWDTWCTRHQDSCGYACTRVYLLT
jgi:hypothetical protein